jgi:hypothetical protein
MSAPQADSSVIAPIERLVLRALCQGAGGESVRETAGRMLKGYRWRDPVHQVVFEIIMSIQPDAPGLPVRQAGLIREQLPSQLTRRGFPDFDFEGLFTAHSLTPHEVERLMQQLVESA